MATSDSFADILIVARKEEEIIQQNPTFHPFKNLPLELRQEIWTLAIEEHITTKSKKTLNIVPLPNSNYPCRPLFMRVCCESRDICTKKYYTRLCAEEISAILSKMKSEGTVTERQMAQLKNLDEEHYPERYIDYEHDILHLNNDFHPFSWRCGSKYAVEPVKELWEKWLRPVRMLALNFDDYHDMSRYFPDFLTLISKYLPALKDIIVIGDVHESRFERPSTIDRAIWYVDGWSDLDSDLDPIFKNCAFSQLDYASRDDLVSLLWVRNFRTAIHETWGKGVIQRVAGP